MSEIDLFYTDEHNFYTTIIINKNEINLKVSCLWVSEMLQLLQFLLNLRIVTTYIHT